MIRRVAKPKNQVPRVKVKSIETFDFDGWVPDSTLKQACRRFTAESVAVAAAILMDVEVRAATRLKAAEWLMDRGYGRPSQQVDINLGEMPTDELVNRARMLAARLDTVQIAGLADRSSGGTTEN